jgi:hypothetical protein
MVHISLAVKLACLLQNIIHASIRQFGHTLSRGGKSTGYCSHPDTNFLIFQGSKAELYFTAEEEFLWKVTIPTMLGRAMFMLAGWFTWAAR